MTAGADRDLLDVAGLRVVVTGGSRGIGAACCRLFARGGAAVLVQYRASAGHASALVEELRALSPIHASKHLAEHFAVGCDVAKRDEVEDLFYQVRQRWSGLDVLVNNAGVWLYDPLLALRDEILNETLAVNVVGSFLCAQQAAPLLADSRDGSIVNVSSTAGQRGEAFHSAYAASKGALISATKSWAVELAPKVRVNCVAPGWVDTDMTAAALSGPGRDQALASIPLGRVATAEDIAGPILFLASSLARHMTGEVLNVNGGSVLVG